MSRRDQIQMGDAEAPGLDVSDDLRAMVRKQAEKRAGLQFVERGRATRDHSKLGGVY